MYLYRLQPKILTPPPSPAHNCYSVLSQGYTNLRRLVALATKLYTFASNTFSIITAYFSLESKNVYQFLRTEQKAPDNNERFTGHSRIVGPQCGTCFMPPFGASKIWSWHIQIRKS